MREGVDHLGAQLLHQMIVEYMIIVSRYYLPYLRIIRGTSGLYGRPYLVSPFRGVIVYDASLSRSERYEAVSAALHQLWATRHLAGLNEYQHIRRHLSAVS